MSLPENRSYTAQHEWLEIDGDVATVGITAFAADALGDVVYLELPAVGAQVSAGTECGEIESTKSVSERRLTAKSWRSTRTSRPTPEP